VVRVKIDLFEESFIHYSTLLVWKY
jgi:hypothetical protein